MSNYDIIRKSLKSMNLYYLETKQNHKEILTQHQPMIFWNSIESMVFVFISEENIEVEDAMKKEHLLNVESKFT